MPVASASARTQFTHLGLFSQRYGSFAGKTAASVSAPEIYTIEVSGEFAPIVEVSGSFKPIIAVEGSFTPTIEVNGSLLDS